MDRERLRERLEELKASPNVRAQEVIPILEALGAKRRKKGGSDHVYSYPGMYPLTLPYHKEGVTLKKYARRKAIQWIEEMLERMEGQL